MIDEQIDESLSALVDGELPRARASRVLDRTLADEELRERWRRYHLIGAALSPEHLLLATDDELASRVNAALDMESRPMRRPTRRLPWAIGLAAAAGVASLAVLVMFGVSNQQSPPVSAPSVAALNPSAPASVEQSSSQSAAPAVASSAASNTIEGAATAGPGDALTRMAWNDARPAVEARLNGYLLEHSEYLADGVRGMLPYARVVGYDARN